jgi:AP-1 complex subunit beta-1
MVPFQNIAPGAPNSMLQVAVKNNQQPVWYFNDKIPLHVFFVEDGKMERASFLEVKSKMFVPLFFCSGSEMVWVGHCLRW